MNTTILSWSMSESQLQDNVIDAAKKLHCDMIVHFRPARVIRNGKEIYETPYSGDGKGFPDLLIVHGDRLIFAELKKENAGLSPEQINWHSALKGISETSAHIWRPSDWFSGTIENTLR